MTNKEIEIIAKSPDIIRKFEELGELHKSRLDSAENNEAYKRMIKVISFEVKSKCFKNRWQKIRYRRRRFSFC